MENKTLRKLMLKTISANFKQFISVILIIFLSFALLSGFVVNNVSFENTVSRYFEETELADLWLQTDLVTDEDESFFQENGLIYSKRLYIETTAKLKDNNAQSSAKIYIYDGKIFNETMHTGTLSIPYVNSANKICYLDKIVAGNEHVNLGLDEISISIREGLFGQNFDFDLNFIVDGTMSHVECADVSSWPVFIEKENFIEQINRQASQKMSEIGGESSFSQIDTLPYNEVLFKTKNVAETKQLLETFFVSKGENVSIFDRSQIESVILLESEVLHSKKMIYVYPTIFLIVAVLVILTSINQLVVQEKYKIGLLKSLGIPDKKLLFFYSQIGAILCAIGASLGFVFGPIFIPELMNIKYYLTYSLPNDFYVLKVPFVELFMLLLLIVLSGLFVAFFVCLTFLHKSPVECFRENIKLKIVHKNPEKILKKCPKIIKISFRNLRIKPIRTIMAIIGVAGCGALMLAGFGIGDTLSNSVRVDFEKNYSYDISTSFNTSNFAQNLAEIDDVSAYELNASKNVKVEFNNCNKNVILYNLQENSQFCTFSPINGETLISSKYARELKLKVGDKIILFDGITQEERIITKIVDTSLINGVFVTDCDALFQDGYVNFAWISSGNKARLEQLCEQVNAINGTNTAKPRQTELQNAENKISSIVTMTTMLKVFAVFLIVVVLVNFIYLILKERKTEYATLKVMGISELNIWLSLLIEMAFIGLFGAVLGLIFGYPLLLLTLSINQVEIIYFLAHINFWSYFVTFVLILATILIVSVVSFFGLRKIDVIESLKIRD